MQRTLSGESDSDEDAFSSETATIWYITRDLRLHDNPTLAAAIAHATAANGPLYPVYVFDPRIWNSNTTSFNLMRFVLESIWDLDTSLQVFGSRVFFLVGHPEELLPQLVQEWAVDEVFVQTCTEQPMIAKMELLRNALLRDNLARMTSVFGHTLWDLPDLLAKNGGSPPLTYGAFCKLIATHNFPRDPLPPPSSLPQPVNVASAFYEIPSLAMLGFAPETPINTVVSVGGEKMGLFRMNAFVSNAERIESFCKPRTNPLIFDGSYQTTVLSSYIAHGCLSVRLLHQRIRDAYQVKSFQQLPTSLIGQLYWREFFYLIASAVPDFDSTAKNPLTRKIQWDDNPRLLAAWCSGKTGFPFIDACIRQILQEGHSHHLCRHTVATFFSRGDLYLAWDVGARFFLKYCTDSDWVLANANWIWLSASGFWCNFFMVSNPISFGKQYDEDGLFVKKYVPELSGYPREYVYEPWTAPREVQQQAQCIIGEHYPEPIVDHESASKSCISRLKAAFSKAEAEKDRTARKRLYEEYDAQLSEGDGKNLTPLEKFRRQHHTYWMLSNTALNAATTNSSN